MAVTEVKKEYESHISVAMYLYKLDPAPIGPCRQIVS